MKKKSLNKKIRFLDIKILKNKKGNLLKIFNGKDKLGDCYISYVNKNKIKAWRYHKLSEQRIFLLSGKCKVVVISKKKNNTYILTENKKKLLIIPKKSWYGFQNIGKDKVKLLNIINIKYSEKEIERKNIQDFNYDWK
jgi:dTDP-4-dehydrorhamnose 3,5-epimerase-like enzyme